MTTEHGNPARREPLLWLQLLGLAALPLEVAALLLVLAGADPGPLPGLERVFCWALGALAPAVLFWKLPPDLWSLLVLQVPVRGRRPEQLRLSALQGTLPLQLLGAAGALLLLPLLWWADNSAGVAWAWSPLASSPRLVVLMVASLLLTLLLWQWQQLVQALWMFSRSGVSVTQTLPLSSEAASEQRLNIGLPLLLLAPLEAPPPAPSPNPSSQPSREPAAAEPPQAAAPAPHPAEPEPAEPVPSQPSEAEAALPDPGEAAPPTPEPPTAEAQEPQATEATEPAARGEDAEANADHPQPQAGSTAAVAAAPAEGIAAADEEVVIEAEPAAEPATDPAPATQEPPDTRPDSGLDAQPVEESQADLDETAQEDPASAADPAKPPQQIAEAHPSASVDGRAIAPEEGAEQAEGADLDQ